MDKPVNLKKLSSENFKKILDSFDTVLSDCDGVIWLHDSPIAGALDTLKHLEELGKKILFVSNNSTQTIDGYLKKLESMGYNAQREQIITPAIVILWYLKTINFQGKALVIGSLALKNVLSVGGIDVISGPDIIEENVDAVREVIKVVPEVKAVICDFELNLNWAKIMQAVVHLQRKDILFLTGSMDKTILLSAAVSLIGFGDFVKIIVSQSGRVPIECAKPSEILRLFLTKNYFLDNPKRCIFIGDSLSNDTKFARLAGFQNLWVGSGVDLPGSEKFLDSKDKPDFYLSDLGILGKLIDQV